MGEIDCQNDWKLTWTSHGGCIVLDTKELYSLELKKYKQNNNLKKIKKLIDSEPGLGM